MTITLEAIKSEHAKVADMIAAFERQSATTERRIPGAVLTLAPGELYAGLILGEGEEADYHLILLPGEAESINWKDAGRWAKSIGGELPTRREQSLLFANVKGEFQAEYYWSSQIHESNSGWAWCQGFSYGFQTSHSIFDALRARAVRRFIPSVI
jgi:hypothetical protein